MANFSSLKQAIQNYIKENGNKEITGNLLQEILLSMVVTMGDNAINSLTTVVNELNTILHNVDAEPTKNSENLVRSGGVWSGINREALRAFNAETFEARFNSSNNRVEFFNQSGDMLYWYDASAFVVTGLVVDVYVDGDNLVFVIDTQDGEKTIEVPLTDIFNPNNYYTKTQIDGIVRAIRELYDGAEYRGFITPSSQAESKQGVKMVCFATEAGTYTNFLANYDTPIVIPVRGIWVFERGVDADDWTAYSLLEIDKVYAPAQASGMGRVVLQKNMVGGVNTLTQAAFEDSEGNDRGNTIYVIQYDFTLGEDITVPANCVLEFDGGSIGGAYTITGNNTHINWNGAVIFGSDIVIAGTWICPVISTKMFSDLSTDNALRKLEALNTDDIQTSMYIDKADYDYYFSLPTNYDSGILIHSNTDVYLNGTIRCKDSAAAYNMINIIGKKNINICGSGSVIGDRDIHSGTGGEWGHCLGVYGSDNININGISIYKAWGDGICIGLYTSVSPSIHCANVCIKGCEIFDCRRQGISIGCGDRILIDNCYIHDIEGAKPEHCIDIEPNDASCYLNNIIISNCRMKGKRLILATYTNQTAKNVLIDNCYLESTAIDAIFSAPIDTRTNDLKVVFRNNYFTHSVGSLMFTFCGKETYFIDNEIKLRGGACLNGGILISNNIQVLPNDRSTAPFSSANAPLMVYNNEITILENTETPSAFYDRLFRGNYDIDFNGNKVYVHKVYELDFNLTTQTIKNLLRSRNYFSKIPHTTNWIYLSDSIPRTDTAHLPSGDVLTDYLNVYNTDLKKPIWWNGSDWVDATGATV